MRYSEETYEEKLIRVSSLLVGSVLSGKKKNIGLSEREVSGLIKVASLIIRKSGEVANNGENFLEREVFVETNRSLRELVAYAQKTASWKLIEDADVSQVSSFSDLFYNIRLPSNLDLSRWNTENVETMNDCFRYSSFKGSIKTWSLLKVRDFEGAFDTYEHPNDVLYIPKGVDTRLMFRKGKCTLEVVAP